MIALLHQSIETENEPQNLTAVIDQPEDEINLPAQLFPPNRNLMHHPQAGLNPLVDAASYLLSSIGKLKQVSQYTQLRKLQQAFVQEINAYQATLKSQHYHPESIIIGRYLLCAVIDDILSHTTWGTKQWQKFSLLVAFKQDHQQNKFFIIMERAIKEPTFYIDLMELMYICLSLGYRGQYRSTIEDQSQLEQITNNLFQHIRAHRGHFSKNLSPHTLKNAPSKAGVTIAPRRFSFTFIFVVTACIVMTIFVSLGYLMDVISDDAYQHLAQTKIVSSAPR